MVPQLFQLYLVRKMFAGFRSLCRMFIKWWIYWRPETIWPNQIITSFSGICLLCSEMNLERSPPWWRRKDERSLNWSETRISNTNLTILHYNHEFSTLYKVILVPKYEIFNWMIIPVIKIQCYYFFCFFNS